MSDMLDDERFRGMAPCGHRECDYCYPLCHRELVARFQAECRARDLELDLERELELNPFEEVEIEYVPVELCRADTTSPVDLVVYLRELIAMVPARKAHWREVMLAHVAGYSLEAIGGAFGRDARWACHILDVVALYEIAQERDLKRR